MQKPEWPTDLLITLSGLENVFYLWWSLGCSQLPFSCGRAHFGLVTINDKQRTPRFICICICQIFDGLESWVHFLWKSTHQNVFTLKINLQINLGNSLPQHLSTSDSISNSEVSKKCFHVFCAWRDCTLRFSAKLRNFELNFCTRQCFCLKRDIFYLISFTNSKWSSSFWFFAVESEILLKFPF